MEKVTKIAIYLGVLQSSKYICAILRDIRIWHVHPFAEEKYSFSSDAIFASDTSMIFFSNNDNEPQSEFFKASFARKPTTTIAVQHHVGWADFLRVDTAIGWAWEERREIKKMNGQYLYGMRDCYVDATENF